MGGPTWIPAPPLAPSTCVILGRSLNLYEFQLCCLKLGQSLIYQTDFFSGFHLEPDTVPDLGVCRYWLNIMGPHKLPKAEATLLSPLLSLFFFHL